MARVADFNMLCDNVLLAQFSPSIRARIDAQGRTITVRAGQELRLDGPSAHFTFFPQTALLSLVHTMSDSASTEVLMVGQEGMLSAFDERRSSNLHALVLRTGTVFQIHRSVLQVSATEDQPCHDLLSRYNAAVMRQLCQTMACYRHHSVQQHLCRWLLAIDDRYPGQPICATHATIAALFGVRREAITHAASGLQRQGALCYHRGRVEWLDRAKLRQLSCECYQALQ